MYGSIDDIASMHTHTERGQKISTIFVQHLKKILSNYILDE